MKRRLVLTTARRNVALLRPPSLSRPTIHNHSTTTRASHHHYHHHFYHNNNTRSQRFLSYYGLVTVADSSNASLMTLSRYHRPRWMTATAATKSPSFVVDDDDDDDKSSSQSSETKTQQQIRYWDVIWEKKYRHLVQFLKDHDGKFPTDYEWRDLAETDKTLWFWCRLQKKKYKLYQEELLRCDNNKDNDNSITMAPSVGSTPTSSLSCSPNAPLTTDQVAKLEALGFVWNDHDTLWLRRYQELLEYRQVHGDCLVPQVYPPNPALGIWVGEQRYRYRRQEKKQRNDETDTTNTSKSTKPMVRSGSLSSERIQLLEDIGFIWNAYDARWMSRYKELHQLIHQHGLSWWTYPRPKPSRSLSLWMQRQRQYYRIQQEGGKSSLNEQRKQLLDDIGFPWTVRSTPRTENTMDRRKKTRDVKDAVKSDSPSMPTNKKKKKKKNQKDG